MWRGEGEEKEEGEEMRERKINEKNKGQSIYNGRMCMHVHRNCVIIAIFIPTKLPIF